LLFAFGVDDCGFAEGGRRDEIANAHALLLCGFDDFLRLFWGVVGEDGPSPHDAHPAAHDRLFLVHEPILAKCIPGERLSRMREHWKATRTSCRRGGLASRAEESVSGEASICRRQSLRAVFTLLRVICQRWNAEKYDCAGIAYDLQVVLIIFSVSTRKSAVSRLPALFCFCASAPASSLPSGST